MALRAHGGFEAGTAGAAEVVLNGSPTWQTTTVNKGTYALRCNPTTTAVASAQCATFSAAGGGSGNTLALATIWFCVYFRFHTLPASGDEEMLACLTGLNAYKASVRINASGNLVFYDSTPTLQATGATTLAADTWYRIEVKVGTSASAAAWEVKINGTSEISGSAANTTSTNAGSFVIGKNTNRNGNTVDFFYDDWAIDDAAYPGAQQTTILVPNANGAAQTCSIGAGSGSHWQIVDEVPNDGNTSYLLTTGTTGDAETEAMTDTGTAGITGTVNGVSVYAFVRNQNGTNNGSLKVRLRSGTTNSDTTGVSSPTSYTGRGTFSATDPATSAAWTTSGVDGAEGGIVENQTGANTTRLTAVYLMVNWTPAGATPISGTELGSGDDEVSSLAGTVATNTDTGAGADATSIAATTSTQTDTASGADAGTVTIAVTVTETGTGVEATPTLTATSTSTETATGADVGSVSTGAVAHSHRSLLGVGI